MGLVRKFSFIAVSVLLVALICVVSLIAGISVFSSAEAKDGPFITDGNGWLDSAGCDLGDYQVQIEYHSYTLNISGLYYSFVVTLDKEFLATIGKLENNVYRYPPIFDEMETLFSMTAYEYVSDEINGQFSASLKFDSITDFYIANGIDGYEVDENTAEKSTGFLYTDYHSANKTAFASMEENENSILNHILKACYRAGAQRDKIKLSYVYGTPYKMISTDADKSEFRSDSRLYLHTFYMTMDNADRTVNIYQHVPNSIGWYVMAVLIAVPFIVAPTVIIILKKRKKREEN